MNNTVRVTNNNIIEISYNSYDRDAQLIRNYNDKLRMIQKDALNNIVIYLIQKSIGLFLIVISIYAFFDAYKYHEDCIGGLVSIVIGIYFMITNKYIL